MLKIWTATTPNGRKAAIMLEETGLAYRAHKIDLSEEAHQFSGLTLESHPHLKAGHDRLWQRPAVVRGIDVPESGPAS